MSKPKVIIIMGPTATGKTGIAVRLARAIAGEIISADSRQVYQDMDIGSGKDIAEYGEVPYHLIDLVKAGSEFSVSAFQSLAWEALASITSRAKTPIICGGTGHYIKALLDDYQFTHGASDRQLTTGLEARPAKELHKTLQDYGLWRDHPWQQDSKRRMARAIEIQQRQQTKPVKRPCFKDAFQYKIFYTSLQRSVIRDRISKRLLQRLKDGMVEETQYLLDKGVTHQRLERYGLEYKYISLYLRQCLSLEETVSKLQTEISRFAKRQMTFIRYMEKQGHVLIPIRNYNELWQIVRKWLPPDDSRKG